MRGICKVLILVALVFRINGVANAELYSGKKLAEDWKAYKIMAQPNSFKSPKLLQGMAHYTGYVAGVIDSYYDLMFFPSEATTKELFDAVGEYLDAHPEEWHEPGVNLVLRALMKRMPREDLERKKRNYDVYQGGEKPPVVKP